MFVRPRRRRTTGVLIGGVLATVFASPLGMPAAAAGTLPADTQICFGGSTTFNATPTGSGVAGTAFSYDGGMLCNPDIDATHQEPTIHMTGNGPFTCGVGAGTGVADVYWGVTGAPSVIPVTIAVADPAVHMSGVVQSGPFAGEPATFVIQLDQVGTCPAAINNMDASGYLVIGDNTGPGSLVQLPPPGGNPSSTCQSRGGAAIIDSTSLGVHTFLATYQPSLLEVDVCFRVSSGSTGVGGMVAITPTVPGAPVSGVGLPTIVPPTIGIPTVDNNSGYCSTPPSGSAPNVIPGTHPASVGTALLGLLSWMFDAYSDGTSTVWVCLEVNSVKERVIVPISPPVVTPPTIGTPSVSVTPGTDVTFYPDLGTP